MYASSLYLPNFPSLIETHAGNKRFYDWVIMLGGTK